MTIPTVGTNSTFTVGLDPGESKFLQTDGLGTQMTGAALVSSDAPIGVSAIFSIFDEQDRFLTETGVGVSSPLKEIVIPVDVTGSFNTGIALYNNSDKVVTAARRLLDQTGVVVDSASLLSLGAKGHLAEFVSNIFPGSDNFRGSVSIFSSDDLAALTLRQNAIPLSFTTLPAERSRETTEVVEAQIGSGGGEIATVSGDTVTISAGTFVTDTNITVKTVSQKDFENLLEVDLESLGFSFVSALEIDSNGGSFERPIQFAADAELFSADAQMIVVTVEPDFDGDGRSEMVFLTGGGVETGVALSEPFDLPAADEGSVIALLSPIELMGFVSGSVLDPQDIPLEDVAIFELSHSDLLAFSDSQGEFALAVSISAGSAAISTSTVWPSVGPITAPAGTLIFKGAGFSGKTSVPGSLPTRPPPRPLDPVRLEPKSDEQANRDLVESLCGDPNNRKLRDAAQKIFEKARGDVEKKIQMVLKNGLGKVPIETQPIQPMMLINDTNPRPVSANLEAAKGLIENAIIDLKLFKPEVFTTKLGIAEMKYTGFSPKLTLYLGILKSTNEASARVINLVYENDPAKLVAQVQGIETGDGNIVGNGSSLKLNLEITVSLSVAGDPICEEISGIQIDPPSLSLASDVDVIVFKELPFKVEFPQFFLGVGKGGPGSGTVKSKPAGIDCGTDCSHLFDSGTLVTLTAEEKEGDSFTGWTGACTGSNPVCKLTMDSDKATTAIFASSPFFLGVGKAGDGSGTVTSDPGKIDCGTVVTLTATPGSGSTFEGWSGACTGTGTCLVTMDGDKAVTATFETDSSPPTTFTLTVSKSGSGSGTVTAQVVSGLVVSDLELGGMSVVTGHDVTLDPAGISCGSDCSEDYELGTIVSLTATPDSGSTFEGWSGDCSDMECVLTMDEDKAVTAIFTETTEPPPSELTFTIPENLPSVVVGETYQHSFCQPELALTSDLCGAFEETTNPTGGQPPYHFTLGTLGGFPPFGILLNLNGLLTGTPTIEGTKFFTVCAIDLVGQESCQQTSLEVKPAAGGSLSGTWQGPYSFVVDLQGGCQPGFTLTHSGTLTMVLSQSGTSFSGSGTVTGVKDIGLDGSLNCVVVNNNLTFGGSVSGTLSGQSVTGQISFSDPDLGVISFSGTLSGNSISGGTLSSPDGSGTFSATKQ